MVQTGEKSIRSRNASASAFGWEFQANAAIFLMLDNIERAEKIKVEGLTEDIEITLENQKVIYSQAKSLYNPDDTVNIIQKLKEALKSLNDASQKDNVEQLIYVSNIPDPFNNPPTSSLFGNETHVSFNELPESCKQKIEEIVNSEGYLIDLNKLIIKVIIFWGENDNNRYKNIKSKIREFISKIKSANEYDAQEILEIWKNQFFVNATKKDINYQITKKDMMWNLIALVCNFDERNQILEQCDSANLRLIKQKYKAIINSKAEQFEFANKVLQDFDLFEVDLMSKKRIEKFINECYKNYEDELDISSIEQEVKVCLMQLIIYQILDNRYIIKAIKDGVNLC